MRNWINLVENSVLDRPLITKGGLSTDNIHTSFVAAGSASTSTSTKSKDNLAFIAARKNLIIPQSGISDEDDED